MEKENDLRIEPVDGAPISLQKVLDANVITPSKDLTVLLDQTGCGIVNDTVEYANVTIDAREEQAKYFLSLDIPLPEYLKKYLAYMYEDDEVNLEGMYKYASTNPELKQLIGFIQLVGGSLNIARKMNKSVKMFIEEPEARLHPKRERRIVSLLEMLKRDYGFNEQTPTE